MYDPKNDMKGRSNSKASIDKYLGISNTKDGDPQSKAANSGKGQGGRVVKTGNTYRNGGKVD